MIRALFDEDLDGAIVSGILRTRPDADAVRAVDVGLSGQADGRVLAFAAAEVRLVISHDRRTMLGSALDRVAAGLPMPGVLLVPRRLSRREVIDELVILMEDSRPEDWTNVVAFLPYI